MSIITTYKFDWAIYWKLEPCTGQCTMRVGNRIIYECHRHWWIHTTSADHVGFYKDSHIAIKVLTNFLAVPMAMFHRV